MAGGPAATTGARRHGDPEGHKRVILVYCRRRVAPRAVGDGGRVLDGGGDLGDPRRGRGESRGRVDGRRCAGGRPRRRGREPLRGPRPQPGLRPGPQLAVLPGGLRHNPPAAADGRAAAPAHEPLLPAPERPRGVLSGGERLGAAAVVHGEPPARRGTRHPGARRVVRSLLVAGSRGRAPDNPREGRPLRHDPAKTRRSLRSGLSGVPATSKYQRARQTRRQA